MENFENKENEIIEEEITPEINNEDNIHEAEPQPESVEEVVEEDSEYIPPYNPVIVDEIKPEEDNKKSFLGLKIFAALTALSILLSAACVTGYFVGKNQNVFKKNAK